MTKIPEFDPFIAQEIRDAIERTFYARINHLCTLIEVLKDPHFLESPGQHVALYADHGVAHVRDVTHQLFHVMDLVNGVLIPSRDTERLTWMRAYGVFVAYVHDIGMIDMSHEGRLMHPEFGTQAVLGPTFNEIVHRVWDEDRGGIAERIVRLHRDGKLNGRAPELVLREMLAMANCHSKSKVPIETLNDRRLLRHAMNYAATVPLPSSPQDFEIGRLDEGAVRPPPVGRSSADRGAAEDLPIPEPRAESKPGTERQGSGQPDAFGWLESEEANLCELVDDVIDTLRVLRSADSLRQRGTEMKTSGNYEVFVDQRTASAVFALRPDENHLYLLEITDPISAGESNLSTSQIEISGDLRVSFHHGKFGDPEMVLRAARNAALVLDDIQADALGSFERPNKQEPGLRPFADVKILIESVDDNPDFAGLVLSELRKLNPKAAAKACVTPALGSSPLFERDRYVWGAHVDWTIERRRDLLEKIAESGHRGNQIDPVAGFQNVRLIDLRPGDILVEGGTASNFVYVPLGHGLRGMPLGGYDDFLIGPFVPVGVTGVIRGAARNATIVADQPVTLLSIPKTVFLSHWNRTFDKAEFADFFKG